MTQPLPCPFCGGEAEACGYESCDCCGKPFNGRVRCRDCWATVQHRDSDEEAIADWNRRSTARVLEDDWQTTIELRTMYLSGPRPDGSFADYFVLVRCGDREMTPYCFRERFKAEYEIATLRWLLLGEPRPDLMSFNEESYPNFPSPPKAGE